METYQLASGGCVYHFDTGPFNWYVISQNGRLTVVDAGFPGHYRVFLNGIRALGYGVKDVAAIILTHAHADHLGFAEQLRKESKAPIFIHTEDAVRVQRVLQLPWYGLLSNAWRPFVISILAHAALNGVFVMPRIHQIETFKDGDILDVPGRPHVLSVPGHTLGEVAFHIPESNILFSGDTIVTRNLMTGVQGQPQLTPRILNHDYNMAYRSLDRLRELGSVTVLPGHGKSWQGMVSDAIEIARQSHIN